MFLNSLGRRLGLVKKPLGLIIAGLSFSVGSLQAEDIDFFALPSPNEIMYDAESQGLKIKISRDSVAVIALDLNKMVKEDPVLTSFQVGRTFAVAGYGFKKLNNEMILKLAEKVLSAMKQMDLPEVVVSEINEYYNLMVAKKQWDRNELMLSFTSARASLLYLLKDSKKIEDKDKGRVQSLATALEYGIWFQSLELALDSLQAGQNEAFQSVYLDEDYLNYFKKQADAESTDLFKSLSKINDLCFKTIKDEVTTDQEIVTLKAELNSVLTGGAK